MGRGGADYASSPSWSAVVVVVVSWLVAWSSLARADATPEEVARWQQSVVLLLTGPAWCSGVVVDDEGTVATAHHCVASGLRSKVTTRSGDTAIGRIVSTDPDEDLALLSVPEFAGKVPPLVVRDEPARIGEIAYGLGHPFAPAADRSDALEGMLLWSVTKGIVSAVGPRLIQTDAALNPGNSGGPVVDEKGRVLGITSRKLGGDNVAFASSAAQLRTILDAPRHRPWVQGTVGLGVGLVVGSDVDAATGIEVTPEVVVRDRIALWGGIAFPLGARGQALEQGEVWYPVLEANLGLRQRLGRGRYSTAVEAGGGALVISGYTSEYDLTEGRFFVLPLAYETVPALYGRIVMGGSGLRLVAALRDGEDLPTWLVAVDLGFPGVLATF